MFERALRLDRLHKIVDPHGEAFVLVVSDGAFDNRLVRLWEREGFVHVTLHPGKDALDNAEAVLPTLLSWRGCEQADLATLKRCLVDASDPVDCILEHCGWAAVVFRRTDEHCIGGLHTGRQFGSGNRNAMNCFPITIEIGSAMAARFTSSTVAPAASAMSPAERTSAVLSDPCRALPEKIRIDVIRGAYVAAPNSATSQSVSSGMTP